MEIHVISIFPEMFSLIAEQGVISRAIKQGVLSLTIHNPRDFADDKHSTVDGRPYGGGPGMVMMLEPLLKAITAARLACDGEPKVIYLSPQGQKFSHQAAVKFADDGLAQDSGLVLLAGRYEGVDERVITSMVDEEWSIGDYVLSGGELPSMVMIDAIARLLPNSLGNAESAKQDSFVEGLLDCPQYSRPEQFEGQSVPGVLLSGDHQAIADWRMMQSLGRTWLRRPELLKKIELTDKQVDLLEKFKREL